MGGIALAPRVRGRARSRWTGKGEPRDFRETSSSAFQKWSRQVQFVHVLSCQPLAMHLTFQQLPIKAVAQLRQAVLRGHARPLPDFHFNSTSLPWLIRAGMRLKFAQAPQSSAEFLEALRAAQDEQNVVEATSQHVSSSVSIHTLMAQRSRYAQRAMHATMAPDAVDCTALAIRLLVCSSCEHAAAVVASPDPSGRRPSWAGALGGAWGPLGPKISHVAPSQCVSELEPAHSSALT